MDSYKGWKKSFPHITEDANWYNQRQGELVLIFQQGWGPRKNAPFGEKFPTLESVYNRTQAAKIEVNNLSELTKKVYDVGDAALKTLREDQGILMAKHLAGLATKAVLSDQIRQKNEALGSLAWIAMNLADRADLRQWSTLPSSIQIARVNLPPGKYSVNIQGIDNSGVNTSESRVIESIEIKPGQKKFIVWRSLK